MRIRPSTFLADTLIARLRDLALSSRIGMVDRGFPRRTQELIALGYAVRIANGAKITEKGIQYIKENREQLRWL